MALPSCQGCSCTTADRSGDWCFRRERTAAPTTIAAQTMTRRENEDVVSRHTRTPQNVRDRRPATHEDMSPDPTLLRMSVQMPGGGPRTQ